MNELFNKSLNFTIEREKKKKKFVWESKNKFSKNLPTDLCYLPMITGRINRRDISYIDFDYEREESMNPWILLSHHVLFFIRPPVIRGYRIWLFPLRDYRSCGLSRLRNCIRISIRRDESNMEGSELLLELSFSKLSNFFFL